VHWIADKAYSLSASAYHSQDEHRFFHQTDAQRQAYRTGCDDDDDGDDDDDSNNDDNNNDDNNNDGDDDDDNDDSDGDDDDDDNGVSYDDV
jgi:hypothetical protein